jgi:hypothetical protein
VSKAILRTAVDEFFRDVGGEGVAYYWPSYEIVMDVFGERWMDDRRHVKREILDLVMVAFEEVWCRDVEATVPLAEAWAAARAASGTLPRRVGIALKNKDPRVLARIGERIGGIDGAMLKKIAASML